MITEFKNSNYFFITWSTFYWSTKDVKSLSDSSRNQCAIFAQESGFNYTCEEYYLQQNTVLICRQLFAGHVVGPHPMKRKEKNTLNDNIYYLVHNCQRSKCFLFGQSKFPHSAILIQYHSEENYHSGARHLNNYWVTSKLIVSYQNSLHQILWVIYLLQWNT